MQVTDKITSVSKWNVIPIHASDRATFKFCRRQWAWSSPTQKNLIPKTHIHGIRESLWFGTGIHYALERFYNPSLKEDPEATFRAWFNLQWNGGLINADELPSFVDRFPEPVPQAEYGERNAAGVAQLTAVVPAYRVKGLDEILPVPDEEHFMELLDLGCGMMRFYKEYAEANDNFTVIATEHDFSVPVLNPDGSALYMLDRRIPPEGWEPDFNVGNEFGPLMRERVEAKGDFGANIVTGIEKQVHARGRMDMIKQDNENGLYGIQDYKTTSRLDDDYFRHQELDEQCTTYLWAGEIEARLYDLPYKNLNYITYQGLFKNYPKPPTITSRGEPSIDRNNEGTTAEMYAKAIHDLGLQIVFEDNIKWQNYYQWLLETGDRRFIDRRDIRRNWAQKRNMGTRVYAETLDMLDHPSLYPNPTKNYSCLNCVFRAPCIAAEDGSDYESILADGYMPNWDR